MHKEQEHSSEHNITPAYNRMWCTAKQTLVCQCVFAMIGGNLYFIVDRCGKKKKTKILLACDSSYKIQSLSCQQQHTRFYLRSFIVFIGYLGLKSDYSGRDAVGHNGLKSPVVTLIFSTLKAEQQINYTISQASGK